MSKTNLGRKYLYEIALAGYFTRDEMLNCDLFINRYNDITYKEGRTEETIISNYKTAIYKIWEGVEAWRNVRLHWPDEAKWDEWGVNSSTQKMWEENYYEALDRWAYFSENNPWTKVNVHEEIYNNY